MCDYQGKCPGEELMIIEGSCFGTPTGCKIYPIMKELAELKDNKKGYKEERGNFLSAMKKYDKIIDKCKKIFKPTIDRHEEINKLEWELKNIDLDKS